MANPDRLTGLDSSFLHLERDAAHMHVAGCMVFDGPAPDYSELVAQIVSRLHLVPRYRQRLAFVPFGQGRPVWVDDPHFNPNFHVRHTALPAPGDDAQLKRLAGRVFSQALDRSRPLWELWLVEGLSEDRFALLSKTHHALVDGVSGVDIATVLFDTSADPMPVGEPEREWIPRPLPVLRAAARRRTGRARDGPDRDRPRRPLGPARTAADGREARHRGRRRQRDGQGRPAGRPAQPVQRSHRAPPPLHLGHADLAEFKAIKNALGGTVNDVVLAAVAGALGRYLRMHGEPTDDLVLRAMVPVSVRADVERGALGNRVAAMWAPLPVGLHDPVQRLLTISHEMEGIKESGQAVGAQVLTELTGFAPPTIMAQAARLQARQRLFNLVVTNVPGPAVPAVHALPSARGDVSDGPAGRESSSRHRDHELQRPVELWPERRLRRDRGPRGARR